MTSEKKDFFCPSYLSPNKIQKSTRAEGISRKVLHKASTPRQGDSFHRTLSNEVCGKG